MRTQEEIEQARDLLLQRITELKYQRSIPGRADALRSSDAIEMTLAAAKVGALDYALGNLSSPSFRSPLLKETNVE